MKYSPMRNRSALAKNKIRIQALTADLLWNQDEKRARNLFNEVMNSLGAGHEQHRQQRSIILQLYSSARPVAL